MLPALFPLVDALVDRKIAFVVIGGVAVVVHGVTRTTEDLDIVPAPDGDNLLRLGNAMADVDARLATDHEVRWSAEHHDALRNGRSLSLSTSLGELDVVQRLPGMPPYEVLTASATVVDLGDGRELEVASLTHIREMKRAAGRPQDLADLAALDDA